MLYETIQHCSRDSYECITKVSVRHQRPDWPIKCMAFAQRSVSKAGKKHTQRKKAEGGIQRRWQKQNWILSLCIEKSSRAPLVIDTEEMAREDVPN